MLMLMTNSLLATQNRPNRPHLKRFQMERNRKYELSG